MCLVVRIMVKRWRCGGKGERGRGSGRGREGRENARMPPVPRHAPPPPARLQPRDLTYIIGRPRRDADLLGLDHRDWCAGGARFSL